MEVIWGHAFGHGEVKWPPIGLKHWKVEYWRHYLSFDMSHDMGYAKVIVVVMEVIWGHIFWSWWGQMTSNWSKTLKGRILKSLPFIWYVTWHGICKSHCCVHEGHKGHIFSQGVVRWPPIGLKLDQSNTEVITFHLLFCLPRNKKKLLLWSWRSSEISFSVMDWSNDLQFF